LQNVKDRIRAAQVKAAVAAFSRGQHQEGSGSLAFVSWNAGVTRPKPEVYASFRAEAWPDQQIVQEATPTCLARSNTPTPDSNAPMDDHEILKKQAVTTVECLHFGCDSLPILEPALTTRSFKPFTAGELASFVYPTWVQCNQMKGIDRKP
jgi:hypothetical protein